MASSSKNIEQIANRYHAWENPIGINNPYSNEVYWGINEYISNSQEELLIRNTKDIVASDSSIFKYSEQ